MELAVRKPWLHAKQRAIFDAVLQRTIQFVFLMAGRRFGKTTLLATVACMGFLRGWEVRYYAPTNIQTQAFWDECERILAPLIDSGAIYINRSDLLIRVPRTKQLIQARTAWHKDHLRGGAGDLMLLDEFPLMHESVFQEVVLPMILDRLGRIILAGTPPSAQKMKESRATDKLHAIKLWQRAVKQPDRWLTMHGTSHDNPFLSTAAFDILVEEMDSLTYRQEILAEIIEEAPGALWRRVWFDAERYEQYPQAPATDDDGQPLKGPDGKPIMEPDLARLYVGVDPSGGTDEVGIFVGGLDRLGRGWLLEDLSEKGKSPAEWGAVVVDAYHRWRCDAVLGEENYGGDLIRNTIKTIDPDVTYQRAWAARGKAVRAHPISVLYQQGTPDDPRGLGRQRRIYHAQPFPQLENEMCLWTDDASWSPNRLDAAVWVLTKAMKRRPTAALVG